LSAGCPARGEKLRPCCRGKTCRLYTLDRPACSMQRMQRNRSRLNITLDGEHAAKLARLAARVQVQERKLARSLLASAIDEADPDGRLVTEVLDSIPGAWERAQLGRDQARRGETIPLDDL
jgi:hypothetical protein